MESDDSDELENELDEKLSRLIVPVGQAQKASNEPYLFDVAKLPEEKNTEKFFNGYNQRIDLITRLKEDLAKDLKELEPDDKEDESEEKFASRQLNAKPPSVVKQQSSAVPYRSNTGDNASTRMR